MVPGAISVSLLLGWLQFHVLNVSAVKLSYDSCTLQLCQTVLAFWGFFPCRTDELDAINLVIIHSKYGQTWTYTIEDELHIDAGKHVLAMSLNWELFWMNNKAINEFDFRRIWRIKQISEGVIHRGRQHPPRSASHPAKPHLLIAKLIERTSAKWNNFVSETVIGEERKKIGMSRTLLYKLAYELIACVAGGIVWVRD